jgi:UDP-2,3-diacylglucosamine pyrophosphatase LpxH
MRGIKKTIWTEEEEDLLRALTNQQFKIAEIAAQMGRSTASIHNKQHTLGIGVVRNVRQTYSAPSKYDGDPGNIPDWLDKLRPVQLPAPDPAQTTQSAGPFTLVAGDFHFPQHDPASVAILLETIRQLKPKELILNGDTVDLLAVSRYPKDQRYTWDLRQEVVAFHEFLHQVMAIGGAWGLTVRETEANHSGNGTASRWHRYLSDRVPVLYAHPDAEKLLNYETWFYPEWAPVKLVESAVIADDLLVIHGDMVRKHAAYSARGHAEKWHSSVMHSHTHRMGCSFERIPAVGNRPEHVRRAFEIGCMCNLQPSYVSAPNWTNGFAIIQHGEAPNEYGVELVNVSNGQATIVALGQTVKASV